MHVPGLEEPATILPARADVSSPGFGSFSLHLPTEALGWPRGAAEDGREQDSAEQRKGVPGRRRGYTTSLADILAFL